MNILGQSFADFFTLVIAAAAAGVINALAGGGSFLTLAALVWVGVPPVVANATGTFAQMPGYLASAWALRGSITAAPGVGLGAMLVLSLLGGALGAGLLLVTSARVFDALVPWLLLLATVLFAFAPQVRQQAMQWAHKHQNEGKKSTHHFLGSLSIFIVSVYGGYFNGGLGIILLALFSLMGLQSIMAMNGLKALVSTILAAIAVVVYAAGDVIAWPQALIMAVASTLGGWFGVKIGNQIPQSILHLIIVLIGLILACIFFWRSLQ